MLDKIISARDWDLAVKFWSGFQPQSGEPPLDEVIQTAFAGSVPDPADDPVLVPIPGLGISGKASLGTLVKKARAAKRAFSALFQSGNVGWSNVDAYHATFLYIRAYLGFFGIFTVHLERKDAFVDLLPHLGGGKYLTNYRREHGQRDDLVRIWSRQRIEHRHVYEVYNRVSKVVTSHRLAPVEGNWMKNVRDRGYGTLRNRLIYGPTFWPDTDDLDAPIATIPTYDADVAKWNIREEHQGWMDCIVLEQFARVSEQLLTL